MPRAGVIRWRLAGFREVRESPEVARLIQTHVDRVLAEVGTEDYAGGVEQGATRLRGFVVTTTGDSIRDESENHTLLRALTRGG